MKRASPTITELRSVTQPESVLTRPSAEHWSARLYMRRVSPYATRLFLGAGISANTVTALMIPVGIGAGVLLAVPGIAAAAGTLLLIQLQVLLDCSDGEVARWRRTSSPRGIYLDQIAHYTTEAAIPAGLGLRAAGGWGHIDADGWAAVGLLVAVLILILKSETHLVRVSLARAGRLEKAFGDEPPPAARTGGGRFRLRQGARLLPGLRPFQAVEASFLALAAGVADSVRDDFDGSRFLLVVMAVGAVVAVVGHLIAVLSSDRLR